MYSINNVGWIEKDAPKAGPLDAILRPIAVAPCSSDTHVAHGGGGPFENRILHQIYTYPPELRYHICSSEKSIMLKGLNDYPDSTRK